jgi:ABC-2 type transport system ATP-binding protein
VLTGPAAEADECARRLHVIQARRAAAQAHLLVRTGGTDPRSDQVPPGWEAHPVSLEELVLAYLRAPGDAELPGLSLAQYNEPTEVAR